MDERSLFLAALDRPTAERAAYLAAADVPAAVRERVAALLAAHADAGEFPPTPAHGGGTGSYSSAGDTDPAAAGRQIGPYKLLQPIGEGGMGSVWMAEQETPVRRRVALKLIKPGMDSDQVIARFEAERQALALMDHVNIAKVLDAGTTPEGRPFFVMELIRGEPITRYCDANHLTARERLELFVPVCQAVQHAHQKGVIHRDLKPSNVLVTLYDGKPVPKVIDFGVAKALHQRLTDRTMFTEFGAVVGTLEYMAPEQAALSHLDVDTRSDVYSLGVLLYELLTGSTPLERKRLREAAFDEVLRLIREEEPPKPSTRLSTSEALPSIAANRRTEPAKLSRLVRGELDWIVMKALEKDRSRRYETANGFARDVQRYLADEAVEACPPSAAYRLRKFVRRNRGPVLAATLVLVALVGGLATTLWQSHLKELARKDAVAAAEREAEERKKAVAKEAEANAVVTFFENKVFAAGRPKWEAGGLGHDVSLRNAVAASLPELASSFTDQPLVEARLRSVLGGTFLYLGEWAKAAEQLSQARALYARHRGPDHPDTLQSMNNLAISYADLNRYDEALKLREETLAIQKRVLPPDHPDTLSSMHNLAMSYAALNRHAEALALNEETLAIRKRVLPPDHPDTLKSMHNLANSYADLNRHEEAFKLRKETLAIKKRVLPPDHPLTLTTMMGLANSYADLNRHDEALKLFEETLAVQKRVLPPDHPDTLQSMMGLAKSYSALNRLAQAIKLYEETLAVQKRVLPPDHPDTLRSMYSLAMSYAAVNRHDEALKLTEEALAVQKRVLPPDHPDTLRSMAGLANCFEALNRHAEALTLREETLAIQKRVLPPDHPDTLGGMHTLANSYATLNRHDEALKLRKETLAIRKRVLGPDHPDTLKSMMNLANSYADLNRHDEARKLSEATLATQRRVLPPDHPDTLMTMMGLANSYAVLNRHAEALDLCEETLAIQKRVFPPDHPLTLMGMNNLAACYGALNRHDEALKLNEEILAIHKRVLPPDHPHTLVSMFNLANNYADLNRHAEALPLLDEVLAKSNRPGMNRRLPPLATRLRMQCCGKLGDLAGCRATVEMFEKRKPAAAGSLYDAACYRAVTAALQAKAKDPDAARLATGEADKAMAWLHKAVAAGFKDAAHMKKDTDLDALRDREDFKKLIAELEAKAVPKP